MIPLLEIQFDYYGFALFFLVSHGKPSCLVSQQLHRKVLLPTDSSWHIPSLFRTTIIPWALTLSDPPRRQLSSPSLAIAGLYSTKHLLIPNRAGHSSTYRKHRSDLSRPTSFNVVTPVQDSIPSFRRQPRALRMRGVPGFPTNLRLTL